MKSSSRFDTHELAWASGFFDGEGCVGTYAKWKGSTRRQILVGITQKASPDGSVFVLERFQALMGFGTINKRQYAGGVRCQFTVTNFQDIQFICCLLWRWLSPVKKNQFKHAILEYTEAARNNIDYRLKCNR